jgi:hypothetical protein
MMADSGGSSHGGCFARTSPKRGIIRATLLFTLGSIHQALVIPAKAGIQRFV